jgi:hypothetical protein
MENTMEQTTGDLPVTGSNVDALDRAFQSGEISEEQYLAGLPGAEAADDENRQREHAADAQRNAREHGAVNRKPAAQKPVGHPNDGVVQLVDEQTITVDLAALTMLKGATGKVSGYARVLVGGKAIGAFMLYAPADMVEADRNQSSEAKRLLALSTDCFRAGRIEDGQRYLADSDAAQKRYDAARNAAKVQWEGKHGTDVITFAQVNSGRK